MVSTSYLEGVKNKGSGKQITNSYLQLQLIAVGYQTQIYITEIIKKTKKAG